MKNSTKVQEVIVDVTEEEYQADLARGLEEDEVLRPGRHIFRRGGFITRRRRGEAAEPGKVRVSIDVDEDVLDYFQRRATQPNGTSYAAEMAETLRAVMEQELAAR